MKIAVVADLFSLTILRMQPGIQCIALHPVYWRLQLGFHKVDLLFAESAWLGEKGEWKGRVASYKSKKKDCTIYEITNYCRKKKIPSIFWNKEDPVSFLRFIDNAKQFDHVFTTEEQALERYKSQSSYLKTAAFQPIFFQPLLHNPTLGKINENLNDQVVFCGGLYKKEFPDRAERLLKMTEAFTVGELTIFDRFDGDETNANSWGGVKGVNCLPSFSYTQSKQVYQSAVAHVNVNSFDRSCSMYSRRLIELLACNAKVINITNYKECTPFREYVLSASTVDEIKQARDLPSPKIDFDYLEKNYSINTFIKRLERFA